MTSLIRKNKVFKKLPREALGKPDTGLLILFLVLTIFGLVMLASASGVESFKKFGDTYHLFWRQVSRGLTLGLVLFFFFSVYDYKKLIKFTPWFLVASFVLLIAVFIPGVGASYEKAHSWINVGGISFQPTEIVKLLLILFFSGWFAQKGREMIGDFRDGFVPYAGIMAIIAFLVMMQPDMGTLISLIVITFTMYFVAGAKWQHIISLASLGGLLVLALIIQAPYRLKRLMTFLSPSSDPLDSGYHIGQAFLAVGSGGLFGLGFGQSRQKFAYLPEVMGDSIFAVIAEELGFVFSVGLILLFVFLVWKCLRLYQFTDNQYGKYIIVGIMSWFCFQAFFNISAMLGLMPLTGVPLPFVSYGATALAFSLAGAGILVNISRQVKPH
jgi:cell division protein FtsW